MCASIFVFTVTLVTTEELPRKPRFKIQSISNLPSDILSFTVLTGIKTELLQSMLHGYLQGRDIESERNLL